MAIQQLFGKDNLYPSLGQSLGTGLGEGLSALLSSKVQDIQRQKRSQEWQNIGLPSNVADFLVNQPEPIQREFLDRLEGLNISQPGQASAAPSIIQQQQQSPESLQKISAQNEVGEQAVQSQAPQSNLVLGPSSANRKHREIIAAKEQAAINKEVLPFIKETQAHAKAAKDNDIRLNRMEELVKSGKLNNPQFASLLKTLKHGIWGLGIDLSGLLTKEGQEFEKLSNDFVKNAKDVFGGKLTDADLKTFLSTVPNLTQSNEGKIAVINNLKLMNQAAELRNAAARVLIKKYGNKLPLDFESQVDEMVEPQLKEISEKFKRGYSQSEPVAKTQTFLGDVIGAVPGILLGNS